MVGHKRNIVDQQRRLMVLMEEAQGRLGEPLSEDQLEELVGNTTVQKLQLRSP
jgi:hypothetical protein